MPSVLLSLIMRSSSLIVAVFLSRFRMRYLQTDPVFILRPDHMAMAHRMNPSPIPILSSVHNGVHTVSLWQSPEYSDKQRLILGMNPISGTRLHRQ